jgi:hypothetical protein
VADFVSILKGTEDKRRKKVAARIRMLLSNEDNEVVMAARDLDRVLKSLCRRASVSTARAIAGAVRSLSQASRRAG